MNKGIDALHKYIENIGPPDEEAMLNARKRQDFRVKVPGSLGVLEDISIRLAGITGKVYGNDVSRQAIILMCGDNGIVAEGVASAPQSVTQMQTINFTKRITGVGTQADYFGIDLLVVDVGVKLPLPKEYLTDKMFEMDDDSNTQLSRKIVNRHIASGTKNFSLEPAMTTEEALRAIWIGIEAAEACAASGKNIIGVGEMGIGNTTTASAIISAILIRDEEISEECFSSDRDYTSKIAEVVGRGGGLSNEGLARKIEVINDAIKKYADEFVDDEKRLNTIGLLRCVGGFDIAAMTGAFLGAAANHIPVVIDGVISMAAAMLAVNLSSNVKDYMFASHKSKEAGYSIVSKKLGLSPMFDLRMRLGEGSGCPIAFKIIEAACAVMNNMKSLDEAQVDGGYLDQFRTDGQFE